jgi:hypothetical protein
MSLWAGFVTPESRFRALFVPFCTPKGHSYALRDTERDAFLYFPLSRHPVG